MKRLLWTAGAALGSGLFFTSVSLIAAWLGVHLVLGPELDTAAWTIIAVATLTGSVISSWWAQPGVSRIVAAVRRRW